MGNNVFIAMRPAQFQIAAALAQSLGGGSIVYCNNAEQAPATAAGIDIIRCPAFASTESDIIRAPEALSTTIQAVRTRLQAQKSRLFIPRYSDPGPFHIHAKVAKFAKAPTQTYYEGIGSYTMNDAEIIAANPTLDAARPNDPIWTQDFIGVEELDQLFNKQSHPNALSLQHAFPKAEPSEVPDALNRARRIHISTAFSEKNLSSVAYHEAIINSELERGTDLFVLHPAENLPLNMPLSKATAIKLPRSIEAYRDALTGKTITTTFSTAAFILGAAGIKVEIIDPIPAFRLRSTPNVESCYAALARIFGEVEQRTLPLADAFAQELLPSTA